ncbi:hypothetical protein [Desertibaculum subflavum]|uniref:hypothetical protein n=1 Tax=Desertibaculum subflavum TaxID=2268458 RepID=UPI000E6754C0
MQRVDGLTGKVSRGPFGSGSKSERMTIWLETPEGRFVLRRKGGPTFGDRALDKYVGMRVSCDGFIADYMLLAERIEILP